MSATEATCTKCGETKAAENFGKRAAKKNGLHSSCRSCTAADAKRRRLERGDEYREYMQAWRAENRDRIRAYDRTLRRYRTRTGPDGAWSGRFRLSDYEEMFWSQGGGCAICGGTNPSGKRLHVDHDHKTNEIRALLCSRCNVGIGHFLDDPELLRQGARYLEKYA